MYTDAHQNPNAARAGYYPTTWPSEHTDLWRSHTVLNAGLPSDFNSSKLLVSHADIDLPVWGYTRDSNQVFAIGGSPAVIDVFTKMILAGRQIPIDPGSHSKPEAGQSRKHTPLVARIDPFTMEKQVLLLEVGSTVNYTGGMLIHANGYIYALAQSVLYKIDPDSMSIVAHQELPLVGAGSEQFFTVYNGMQVIASGELVLKGFDLISNSVEGWLLLVDPGNLEFKVVQQAQVSSPRLTIDQRSDGTAYLYLLNGQDSTRYLITETAFVLDKSWTAAYRTPGSTQASSPVFFGDRIVFSDNTSPVAETAIKLFSQPVADPPNPLKPWKAFREIKPGINFFMIGGDPFVTGLIVVFDPINGYVAVHRNSGTDGLEPVWERSYKMSASPAIVPDRDFLYIDDYKEGHDHLVVLRLTTGEELARVALVAQEPTVGCIFVGMNQDVYILNTETEGRTGYISRIYAGSK